MRKFKIMRVLGCLITLLSVITGLAASQELTVVTEEWPPYNFAKDGEITGVSTEIVKAALAQANVPAKIELYPWARAYDMALKDKNVLIYTILRTPERENLFSWVGPLVPAQKFFLYKLKTRTDIQLESLEEAKHYKIGVMKDDVTHQFLLKQGFKEDENLEVTSAEELNVKKLFKERIDLIIGNSVSLPQRMANIELPYDQVEEAVFLFEQGYYMAFSKLTEPDLVENVRQAFEKIKTEGKLDPILAKYNLQKQ